MNFLGKFSEKLTYQISPKPELFHEVGQRGERKDGQIDMTKQIVTSQNFVNVPKKTRKSMAAKV
jgi:hypothetical protein